MSSRVHSSAGKSNIPINTTLVAKSQTAQPEKALQSKSFNSKFDSFHLSKVSISSPHRPSQLPPKINFKLDNKKLSGQEERETEQKNTKTATQTFAPSPPAQPQEEDEAKKTTSATRIKSQV